MIVRVVRGCWRLRRPSLDDVRLLAMSKEAFAASVAHGRHELAVGEETLAASERRIEALKMQESLRNERRDAVALLRAALQDDWESVAEIVQPYGKDWTPLVKSLIAVAIAVGEGLAGEDELDEWLEELALELALT